MTASPCIRNCVMADGLCMGCGRTLDEIASWSGLPEHERRAIMALLPARLASHVKNQADAETKAHQQQKSPKGDLQPPLRP